MKKAAKRKRLQAVLFLKFIILLFLLLFWAEPQLVLHRIEEATLPVMWMDEGHVITVMTFNIRHGRGLDQKVSIERIAEVLQQSGADIIALQEVDRYWWRSGMEDQIRRLGEKLEMSWAYAPTIAVGRMQYGNAVLSRYPLADGMLLRMPGRVEPRNVMRVLVEVEGTSLALFNTHLGVHLEERKAQVPLMMEMLSDIEHAAVLLGDFNMMENDPLLQEVLSGWQRIEIDAPTLAGGHRVDHIFVKGPLKVAHVSVEMTEASDHFPLKAQLMLE